MSKGRFEDLRVWQSAIDLAQNVFKCFNDCKQFSLKNQVERAAISISTNIAEGFEQGTAKHFVKYLYIAKGSCGEVRSLIHLAHKLSLLQEQEAQELISESVRLSISIHRLIQSKF